jgi:hypothetical protein
MFHDLTLLRLFGKEQNYNAGCPKHCRIRTKGTGQIQGAKPGRSDLGLSLAGLHPSNEGLFIARERAAGGQPERACFRFYFSASIRRGEIESTPRPTRKRIFERITTIADDAC